jgi:hypothetical protein
MITRVTQNPKTDTEEIRGKLVQKSGTGDEDDAQEESHRRANRGGTAAGVTCPLIPHVREYES